MTIKQYAGFLCIDVIAGILLSLIPLLVLYCFTGLSGVLAMIDDFIADTHISNIISISMLAGLGVVVCCFKYLFNLKLKLKLGLGIFFNRVIASVVSLVHFAGGVLILFSLFYWLVDGYASRLLFFIVMGSLLLIQSAFFSILDFKQEQRGMRKISPPFSHLDHHI